MNKRCSVLIPGILSLLGLLVISADAATPPPEGSAVIVAEAPGQGFVFSPEQAKNHYIGDFVRWAVEDIGNIPAPDAILAVGSSSMRMWNTIEEDLGPGPVLHRGFGGSRMRDVLVYMDFLTRYGAKRVLVYEGDNDLAGPHSEIERDFIEPTRTFIEAMQTAVPDVQIYFISIKPSISRLHRIDVYREANRQLRELCEASPDLHYIDVFEPMLDENGQPHETLFKNDKLHMNADGYAIWTEQIRPRLADQDTAAP